MKVYYCKFVVGVNAIYYRWKLERKGFLCCGDRHSAAISLPKCCLGFSVALNTASVAVVALLINEIQSSLTAASPFGGHSI